MMILTSKSCTHTYHRHGLCDTMAHRNRASQIVHRSTDTNSTTHVTPQNRYYANFSDPAKIRTISILKTPTNNPYTSKHARDAGGINHNIVVSLQQVHEGTHKELIYNNDPNESRIQIYNTKIQIIQKVKYVRVRTRYK